MNGILFDFNGTLFFDSDKNEASWRQFIHDLTGHSVADWEFQEYIHGINIGFTLEHYLGRSLDPQEMWTLAEEKEALYRDLCLADPDHLCLAPGAPAFLDRLRAAGVPMNIATAAAKCNLDFYLETMALDTWFDVDKIVYNDGTFPGKPDPTIYRLAAQAIGLPPAKCTVFEDAKSGITAAQDAGADKVIVIASIVIASLSGSAA